MADDWLPEGAYGQVFMAERKTCGRFVAIKFIKEDTISRVVLGKQVKKSKISLKMGLENYHVKDQIGKGTYGKVFKGIRKTTCQFVAMKFIEDVKSKKEDWAKEVKILKTIKHANVLQMIDCFDTPQGFCIVTELAQGDLSTVLHNGDGLSEEEVQKIAMQLVGALSCLHSKRIVHRDMKPQNTLVFPGGIVKICDFGVARVMSPDTIALRSMIGTLHYMAPELIRGESYNHTADLWSLGLIVYQLYHGHLPFNTKSVYGHLLMWQKGTDLIKYSPNMSSNFKSFVKGLLNTDPTKRLQGSNLLMHPFVSGHCKDVDARDFRANAAGSSVPDVAWKKKGHILTNSLISAKPEGCQLLDWLENKSRSVEDAKLIAQDDEAVLVVLQPLKDQFHRNKDVLALNQSLNIISQVVVAGDINTTRVIYEMLWAIIGFTANLIEIKESDYNDLLVKCFRVLKKLLVKYEVWFGNVHTSHWIAIVGLFKEVAGCTEEVASGRVLYESVSCITAIVFVSRVSQDDHKEMMYYAEETSLEDTLLSCLVTCGTSLMSGSKDFLPAACEVCRAIWSLLTASGSRYTKDSVFVFPLSSMYYHVSDQSNNERDEFDKSSNSAYCRKIADAVTKAFLLSKAIQVAFNLCVIGRPSMGTCFPALQIILWCCLHDNSVSDVLCGFPSSLHVTRVVSGGGDATIISTIFSILSRYASPEKDRDGKLANDALIRDLCLVLATVSQSLKSVGRNSVVFLLTSSPEIQRTRLSDLAHHCSRMQNFRSSVMLALASIFSLESNGASSISKFALPLIPQSTMLCDYLSTVIDGTESKLSRWHGFRDGCVGLLEARLNWDEASTIQRLCASDLPRTLIDLLGGKNRSSQDQIGLSPSGVVWAVSLLSHCLAGRRSTLRAPWISRKNVEVLSTLISDVHLKLISDWDGPGGGKNGVRDTVNAVINLLEFVFVTLKHETHKDINIEKYIEILLEVGIPGQIVRCMEDVELEDAVKLAAFLAKMTLHQSLVVQLLDKGLLDPGKLRRLLGSSSPRKVTLDILRILSNLAKMDKDYYKYIERADIFPFLRKFLTHDDPNVREKACYAISKMCLHSDYFYHMLAKHKIISLLVDCYSDQEKSVRDQASVAIANAARHSDLLYKELGGCIHQLAKSLLLEEEGYISKQNACYMLGNLVRKSDKLCQEIISEGAMKALLELVVKCSLSPCDPREKESLLDASLQALGKLCRHLPCKQFFHSSDHYPVIEHFCQASESKVATSISHIFNKTIKKKGRLARGA